MTRLLYVEDDPLLRTVTTMALEDAGYEVVLAEDGREALRLLEEHGEGRRRGIEEDQPPLPDQP